MFVFEASGLYAPVMTDSLSRLVPGWAGLGRKGRSTLGNADEQATPVGLWGSVPLAGD